MLLWRKNDVLHRSLVDVFIRKRENPIMRQSCQGSASSRSPNSATETSSEAASEPGDSDEGREKGGGGRELRPEPGTPAAARRPLFRCSCLLSVWRGFAAKVEGRDDGVDL